MLYNFSELKQKYLNLFNDNFFNMILEDSDKPWNWYSLSYNDNITWEIIKNNPEKPWVWYCLSYNTNITWDIVKDNPDKP